MIIFFFFFACLICITAIVLDRRKADKERLELALKYQELLKEHRKEIYRLQEEVKNRDKVIDETNEKLKTIIKGM